MVSGLVTEDVGGSLSRERTDVSGEKAGVRNNVLAAMRGGGGYGAGGGKSKARGGKKQNINHHTGLVNRAEKKRKRHPVRRRGSVEEHQRVLKPK